MANAEVLTTTWKPKKHNLLLRQQCRHFVWHNFSKLIILMSLYLSSERS